MQDTTITGSKPLITKNDLATYEQQPLMKKLLEAVSKLNFHYERLQFPLAALSAQNSSST